MRSNTKKAAENIRAYIMAIFNAEYCEGKQPATFEEAKQLIKREYERAASRWHSSEWENFILWLHGLPGILTTEDYFCEHSAVQILGDLLEEGKEERAKYSEYQAERMISKLIAREILK